MRILVSFLLLAVFFTLKAQDKPIVVVELFTSEGCSSCPPADRLLSKIVDSTDEDVEVFGLSFHVDYWDYIGWKDPYANQAYTSRQRAYGRKFGLRSIYTPQMIVNGKHEFVGSSSSNWKLAYTRESDLLPDLELNLEIVSLTRDEIKINVSSVKVESTIINVALVEKGLEQQVIRGENTGRKLAHDNVVRAFKTRSFDGKKNTFTLVIPEDLNVDNSSLIVYSQHNESWKINGAKRMNLVSE